MRSVTMVAPASSMSQRRNGVLARLSAPGPDIGLKRSLSAAPPYKKPRTWGECDASGPEDEDTSSLSQSIPPGKQCAGCLRVTGRDRSFVHEDRGFAWLYGDGRGDWCKDCATVFRLCFRSVMTMSTFAKYVTVPAQRADFLLCLISYVSLRREGSRHLNVEALAQRKDLLEHACAVMGVPFGLSSVTVLTPENSQVLKHAHILPGTTDNKLYALVPRTMLAEMPLDAPLVVTKHQASHGWPMLPCSFLPEELDEVLRASDELFEVGAVGKVPTVAIVPSAGTHTGRGSSASGRGDDHPALQKFSTILKNHEARLAGI